MVYGLREKYFMCIFGAAAERNYKVASKMFKEVVGHIPSYDTFAKTWNQQGLKPLNGRFKNDDFAFSKESCENHSFDNNGKYFDRFGFRGRSLRSNRRQTYG